MAQHRSATRQLAGDRLKVLQKLSLVGVGKGDGGKAQGAPLGQIDLWPAQQMGAVEAKG